MIVLGLDASGVDIQMTKNGIFITSSTGINPLDVKGTWPQRLKA